MVLSFVKRYLFGMRRYIALAALVYFISIFVGYLWASVFPDAAQKIIEEFRQMLGPVHKASPLGLFVFIFIKNAVAGFLAVFAGIVFGIFPLLALFSNGAFLGAFAHLFFQKTSSAAIFLAGILPHGAVEIPAFLFSAAAGFCLGIAVFRRIISGEKELGRKFRRAAKLYLFIILPLFLAAAFIEAFITPVILAAARSFLM